FAVIWALAVAGVIYKLFFYNGGKTERKISAFLYVFMGWIIVAAIVPLIQKAMPATLWFLLAGGLSYSVGVVFYLWQRLPFAHGIFHLFIIAGSISHFFAILVTLL
ncbi:MAG TPA: hemolysin III family protein, partial [Bacteroidales bacterium]|nr:hemolysin III family protein [Bacteroidales bacterium]